MKPPNGEVIGSETGVEVLIDKRAEEDGVRRERMPSAEAEGVLAVPRFSRRREEVLREESLLNITVLQIPVPIFGLDAGVRRKFLLNEDVSDFIPLVGVFSKPVGGKVESTDAEGCLLVDARDNAFSTIRAMLPDESARLEREAISVENGVELIEGQRPRSSGH